MQLFYESFAVEGEPHELAIFAKNYDADEIRMSDCCNSEEFVLNGVSQVSNYAFPNDGLEPVKFCDCESEIVKAIVHLHSGDVLPISHSFESFDAFRNEVFNMIRLAIANGHRLIPIGDVMVDCDEIKYIEPIRH